MSKKGFITTRLRSLFRDRPRIPDEQEPNDTNDNLDLSEDLVEDKIEFLKFATEDQTHDIFNATKETFNFRNRNRQELVKRFPRFIDTNGLVSCINFDYVSRYLVFLKF